jgi:hypothetical protein
MNDSGEDVMKTLTPVDAERAHKKARNSNERGRIDSGAVRVQEVRRNILHAARCFPNRIDSPHAENG